MTNHVRQNNKTISFEQYSKNFRYLNNRIKKFRNYLPHWGWFSQQQIVFSAEFGIYRCRTGFRSGLFWKYQLNVRSSHWNSSAKKIALKIFANFARKHLCWSLFLIEPSGLQLYKKVSPTQVFSCGICKIFKSTYFEEHLRTTASETSSKFTRAALFW